MDFRYNCSVTKKDGTPVHVFTGTVFHDTAEAAAQHLVEYYSKLWPKYKVGVEVLEMKVYKYKLAVIYEGGSDFYAGTVDAKKLDDAFDLLENYYNGEGQLNESYFTALEVTDGEDSLWGSITEVYETRPV